MTSVLCDVTLWLEHAKEVRALCEVISDPEEKEQMLVVAAGFDRIAELAKEQAMLQKQCRRSTYRPARASRAQKRRARKNAAPKARRARPFLTKTNERLPLHSRVEKQLLGHMRHCQNDSKKEAANPRPAA